MNKGEVYITYENCVRTHVTGVFANKKLAQKECFEKEYLDHIDTFEIKGSREDDFHDDTIVEECKYFKPHLYTIRKLISCLYDLDGCACGGLAHIVTDDNNIEDHHIQTVLEWCDEEENKDRTERGLVKLICEELLKLSIPERVLLYSGYYGYRVCDKNCETCPIHKGNLNEVI